jgi:hypothetical protein
MLHSILSSQVEQPRQIRYTPPEQYTQVLQANLLHQDRRHQHPTIFGYNNQYTQWTELTENGVS